ncbi:hypothetical protein B0T14DRAFT_553833 [Immersiella caudata]|uniref:Uncharacterized protein n=1 Tax=Immersiella caudata TaxID=314043 RepID=A0AA40C3S8_9PEZI|nr:hypothetical protein B0T14DRAFT_553833 [Immersiella caudata]
MASSNSSSNNKNNALPVDEGLLGDPPYLDPAAARRDQDFSELVARLPGTLMDEVVIPTDLPRVWDVLDKRVRGLAFTIADETEHRPWDALNAQTRDKLLEIAPTTAERFWGDYDGHTLITAWFWRIITDEVFCNPHRYYTPVWRAFGTLDAVLSRRAGTLDGAIHPHPPVSDPVTKMKVTPSTNTLDHVGPINAAWGHGVMEPFRLGHQYHEWRTFTYSMLRHEEAAPHASPDRLARAMIEAVTAAFDFQDDPEEVLGSRANEIAELAVRMDGYLLMANRNLMPTYRLPASASKRKPRRRR